MAEEKKTAAQAAAKTEKQKNAKPSFGQRLKKWFKDYKSEFKKINWPTWHFTWSQALIVIVAMIIIGAFVFVLDTGFNSGIQALADLV